MPRGLYRSPIQGPEPPPIVRMTDPERMSVHTPQMRDLFRETGSKNQTGPL